MAVKEQELRHLCTKKRLDFDKFEILTQLAIDVHGKSIGGSNDLDKAFQVFLDKLVEDTKKLKNDPNYIRIMADIWNNYLKPNEKANVGEGQRFDFQLVLSDMNLMQTTAAYNFVYTLSKFPPTLQDEVVKLMIQAAEATWVLEWLCR